MNNAEVCYDTYCRMVYRVCYTYLRHSYDTEDAVQETFLKRFCYRKDFQSAEHEKAWLLVTAANVCKDMLKSKWNKTERLETPEQLSTPCPKPDETLEAVFRLPEKYKLVIYLFYYEGYQGEEIAKMLHKPHSTIRSYLSEARQLLREQLGE